jgi:hypothetical protein
MQPILERLFVAIVSYRDPECQWTVRDLFTKAARPERIRVGLCWQRRRGEDDHCFLVETRPSQVRTIDVCADATLGVSWARAQAHRLWRGEEYTLQVDSHMRFHDGWDEELIEMLASCPSERAVLSTQPAGYTPPDRLCCATPESVRAGADRHGFPRFVPRPTRADRPAPGKVLAGGYLFAPSRLFREVEYDPAVYYSGDEIGFSARAWTHGWDPFIPHVCLVHHAYHRPGTPRHIADVPAAAALEDRGVARVRRLLAGAAPDDGYGLGSARTLAAFAAHAGVELPPSASAARSA